jgi:hypothetical protein
MVNLLGKIRAGREARPVKELFRFICRDAERDSSVKGNGFDQDVEPVAVGVLPSAADARPESFFTFAIANVIRNVRG